MRKLLLRASLLQNSFPGCDCSEDALPELAKENNNAEQIRMCFAAYQDENWVTMFDSKRILYLNHVQKS